MNPPCHNRPPFQDSRLVQDGWELVNLDGAMTQMPVMKLIPDEMSKGCQQHGPLGEATLRGLDCDGCKWKPEEVK